MTSQPDRPRIGSPRVHYRRVDSTNERAKRLAASGAPHGTIVTADEQTAGRGRQGRPWVAPAGSALLTSAVTRHLDRHDFLLPLAAAVAVCEACEAAAPVACTIKWPNDVWVERRKVAGILVEGRPQEDWAVIGIGVNVTTATEELPAELRETATSLRRAGGGQELAVEPLLHALTAALTARLEDGADRILAAWRERDALRGETIVWEEGVGTAAGIDASGALLVDTVEGRMALEAGEVHLGTAAGGRLS